MKTIKQIQEELLKEGKFILDKNDQYIFIGDVLKVFHFTGARRKKHYMYKQVIGIQPFGNGNFYKVSHLKMSDEDYSIKLDKSKHEEIEIVAGQAQEVISGDRRKIYFFEDRKQYIKDFNLIK